MAIGKSLRPTLVIDGVVQKVEALVSKKSGETYAHKIHLQQENYAHAEYQIFERTREEWGLPAVGEYVAVECSAEDSPRFGTQLSLERPAFDALDRMQSTLAARV